MRQQEESLAESPNGTNTQTETRVGSSAWQRTILEPQRDHFNQCTSSLEKETALPLSEYEGGRHANSFQASANLEDDPDPWLVWRLPQGSQSTGKGRWKEGDHPLELASRLQGSASFAIHCKFKSKNLQGCGEPARQSNQAEGR